MICPRCGRDNREGVQFCTNCHETLLFKCPVCWHVQEHGGTCEKCGASFAAFWELAAVYQAKEDQQVASDKLKARASLLASVLMAPLLGGRWVLRMLFGRLLARLFAR
jgi:predicted amidophosphoribosyltransferase